MKSIHNKLLIMLLIFIIVPYFASVLLIYWHTKGNVERHELQNSRDHLQKTSEELEQYFQDFVDLPYILYRNPDLFRVFENGFEDSIYFNQLEIDKGMKTLYLMRNEIHQVRIYIAKGGDSFTVYDAMVSARKKLPDTLKHAAIQQLLSSKKNWLIEPPHQIENYNRVAIMPKSDKSMVLTVHHKIQDVLSNRFLGIVTVDIDLDRILQICNQFINENHESVYLTDANGVVIYASDRSFIGKPLNENLGRVSSDDIMLSQALTGSLDHWRLVKITSSDYLYSEVRQTAYTSIIVGIGVVLLGLLMVSIISYKITRPIMLLSRKVRRIEAGNLNVPFSVTGDDEIGHLEKHMKEMMNRINRHIEREYRLEIENKTNQFRALKSQINPHFMNNALQSIGAVALRSDAVQVYGLITSLSNMMRYTIRKDNWSSVRNEVEYVKEYLNLQKERFRVELQVSIRIPDQAMDIQVPSMILQPLVENFFKHCFEDGRYESKLDIYGELDDKRLLLQVKNDGPGLSSDELQALSDKIFKPDYEGKGSDDHIGLKNIHERLMLNYGSDSGIQVDSAIGQGFSVRLIIPLHPKEGEQI